MRDRLLRTAVWASGVVCLAIALLWARSYLLTDVVNQYRQPHGFSIISSDGLLMVSFGEFIDRNQPPPPRWDINFWPFRSSGDVQFDLSHGTTLGFGVSHYLRQQTDFTADWRSMTFPWWLPAAVFAILPSASAYRVWRAGRTRVLNTAGQPLLSAEGEP